MESSYKQNGYLVVDDLFNEQEMVEIEEKLAVSAEAGNRSMLAMPWCASVARSLQERIRIDCLDLANKDPVQCTYFQKNHEKNWLVSWHQDRSLPVLDENVENSNIRIKDGQRFYQPSNAILEEAVAVRLSIDSSHSKNGGLRIIPKSHRHGIFSEPEITKYSLSASAEIPGVARGSAMVMSPLILHSSSKAQEATSRRVLHFTFV